MARIYRNALLSAIVKRLMLVLFRIARLLRLDETVPDFFINRSGFVDLRSTLRSFRLFAARVLAREAWKWPLVRCCLPAAFGFLEVEALWGFHKLDERPPCELGAPPRQRPAKA
jgi:hypothetical protein